MYPLSTKNTTKMVLLSIALLKMIPPVLLMIAMKFIRSTGKFDCRDMFSFAHHSASAGIYKR